MPLLRKKLTSSRNLPSKDIATKKQAKPDPPEEAEQEEEQEQEAKPAKKKGSWAAAFDSVPLTNNATGVKAGEKYEAIIRKAVLQPEDEKGQSVRMNCELCSEDFSKANQVAIWFKISDSDGDSVDGGVKALRITLAKLEYEEVTSDNLEDILAEINETQPGVILKPNLKDGYLNYRVEELCDNEVVQEYRDNIPY